MNAFMRTLAVLLPAVVLWGCSSSGPITGDGDTGAATTGAATTASTSDSGVMTSSVSDGSQVMGSQMDSGMDDPNSLLSKRTVYFDFDKSEIKSEARAIIEAHAKHLAKNPSLRVTLEGHCDERGTREYNLGLGERRAKAVDRVMSLMGVSPSQLELVSYGEERPVAMGHSEDAWAQNRRVEFIYR